MDNRRMEGMRKTVLVVGSISAAMLLACMAVVLTAVPGASQTVTLVGAGDFARCDFKADRKTAKLLGRIQGTAFSLGDNVYPECCAGMANR
jgi:hypothetical protein